MKVGSIVECVNDSIDSTYAVAVKQSGQIFPVKGKIYTVRGFQSTQLSNIYLEEIVNSPLKHLGGIIIEVGFRSDRFRELLPPIEIQDALDSCEPVLIEITSPSLQTGRK